MLILNQSRTMQKITLYSICAMQAHSFASCFTVYYCVSSRDTSLHHSTVVVMDEELQSQIPKLSTHISLHASISIHVLNNVLVWKILDLEVYD